jgi:hypothetical protein
MEKYFRIWVEDGFFDVKVVVKGIIRKRVNIIPLVDFVKVLPLSR